MNNIVLITGGSRGIGAEIAKYFAEKGCSVLVNYASNKQAADDLLSSIRTSTSQKHYAFNADLTSEEDVKSLFCFTKENYGGLDLLINNAGTTKFINHKNLDELDSETFDYIYKLNLRAPFLCAKYALPLFTNRPKAQIINIASIAATTANGSNIAYCSLKAGLVNMTRSLARALAPQVRVNSISPGLTDTDLTRDWIDYRRAQIDKTPAGRLGSGLDIAKAAYSLFYDMSFITGQDIIVDGGRVLSV